jgi:hypothetical protein
MDEQTLDARCRNGAQAASTSEYSAPLKKGPLPCFSSAFSSRSNGTGIFAAV